MRFKVGDKVKFLNDVGGGVISKILQDGRVVVENQDGFDFPMNVSELIPDIKYSIDEENSGQKNIPETKNQNHLFDDIEDEIIEEGDIEEIDNDIIPLLYLALLPIDPKKITECKLDLYLINDSSYHILYSIGRPEGDFAHFIKSGVLSAGNKIFLQTFERNKLNQYPEFLYQIIYFKRNKGRIINPLNGRINIQPMSLLENKTYINSDFFIQKVALYPLIENVLLKTTDNLSTEEVVSVLKQKEKNSDIKKQAKPNLKPLVREVDLHLHELVEDETGLTNNVKLELQLTHFRKELDLAIKNREKKIIFIHGKGQGRLRQEIYSILNREYKHIAFPQDASFQEYGFGATMVLLKV